MLLSNTQERVKNAAHTLSPRTRPTPHTFSSRREFERDETLAQLSVILDWRADWLRCRVQAFRGVDE